MRHRLAFPFALVFALAAGAEPTSPHATVPNAPTRANLATVVDNFKFDVEFTIPGGTCGLTSTVTGTGVYHVVSRISETRAGGLRIAFSETAHGTATGADTATGAATRTRLADRLDRLWITHRTREIHGGVTRT